MFKIPSITAATSTVWSTPSTTGILASLSEKLYSRTLQDSLASHTISIHAGKNNTILHLASLDQPTVLVTSGGTCGLKKAARGTTDAGFQAAQVMVTRIKERGIHMESVHVKLKGFGPGRDQAFRAIKANAALIPIVRLTDVTPIKFGGCRPPKKRRV